MTVGQEKPSHREGCIVHDLRGEKRIFPHLPAAAKNDGTCTLHGMRLVLLCEHAIALGLTRQQSSVPCREGIAHSANDARVSQAWKKVVTIRYEAETHHSLCR
jgi:hypothetical protein